MMRAKKFLMPAGILIIAGLMALVLCVGIRQMKMHQQEYASGAAAQESLAEGERFRILREQLRGFEKAQLSEVAHDSEADAELRNMAKKTLMEIYAREEHETTIEGVLRMRGYRDPVVTVRANSVNVLLDAEEISQQESAAILELVCRETDVDAGNVKIIPIN